KSSLLNALAGETVSPAGPRRPTTGTPLAWVAQSARDETAPLLGWLDVRDVRDHANGAFADVAILDLPDIDSTTPEHRARVDELLPRVDAVVWVADPEKYRDAVLHDQYLRRWAPRLARQLVVLNKADRVGSEAERLRAHLVASLRAEGIENVNVAVTGPAPRPRGAGPFGLVTTVLYRVTGRDRVVADPEGYLRRWRERGSLARAAEPIRNVIGDLLPRVPSETRGAIATLVDAQA